MSAEEPNEGEEKQEETIEKNEIPPQMQKERSSDIEGKNQKEQQTGDDSQEMSASDMEAHDKEIKKQLNKEARQIMKETIHEKEGLIVHRPAFHGKTPEARELHMQVMPIVESLSRQILELLDNEQTETYQKENTKVSGSMQAK